MSCGVPPMLCSHHSCPGTSSSKHARCRTSTQQLPLHAHRSRITPSPRRHPPAHTAHSGLTDRPSSSQSNCPHELSTLQSLQETHSHMPMLACRQRQRRAPWARDRRRGCPGRRCGTPPPEAAPCSCAAPPARTLPQHAQLTAPQHALCFHACSPCHAPVVLICRVRTPGSVCNCWYRCCPEHCMHGRPKAVCAPGWRAAWPWRRSSCSAARS